MILLNEKLGEAAVNAFERGDAFSWTTEDGFTTFQDRHVGDTEEVGNFSMEFDAARDVDAQKRAASPNVVHSMDATLMRTAIRSLGYGTCVTNIHDSLGTRACDYSRAARAVREAFIATKPAETVQRVLNDNNVTLATKGDYTTDEVMRSAYFFC